MGNNAQWKGWLAIFKDSAPLIQNLITWISTATTIGVICLLIFYVWKNGLVLANSESTDYQKSQARKSLGWQVFFIILFGSSTTIVLALMNTVYKTFEVGEQEAKLIIKTSKNIFSQVFNKKCLHLNNWYV